MGTTPVTLTLKKGKYKTIEIRKKCYKPVTLTFQKSFDPVAILNIFWDLSTTDFLTGALWEYSPNHYFVKLQKEPNCSTSNWTFDYGYLNINAKDDLISFALMYFTYLKNEKYFKTFSYLVKKAKCSFNPKIILKENITPSKLISIIQRKCKN